MKTLLIIITVLLLLGCSVPKQLPRVGEQTKEIIGDHSQFGIVGIYSKKQFFCSGFTIDDNYVITAAHCVTPNQKVFINKDIPGRVIGVNYRADYAMILGNFSNFQPLSVELTWGVMNMLAGRLVKACGYPMGQQTLVCTHGTLIGSYGDKALAHGELYPGMSGGPVFDVESNIVIGLNSAVLIDDNIYIYNGNNDLVLFARLTGILGAFKLEE